jgi:hypothetical protein
MLFTNTTFIGIDPTAGERPFVYAALDYELQLLALGQGGIDDVLAFAAGQKQAVAAVCAPRNLNTGVMADAEIRQRLSPPPPPGRWMNFRLVEYLLRQHHISIPQTSSDVNNCPNWMRMGFLVYRRLEKLGYRRFPSDAAELQCLEVYPHASYAVMLEVIPFPKHSLEGRLQRQLVLHEKGINVFDPMRIFEEITRHRLLKGILPTEGLCSAGELDAIVGAFTAWMAVSNPDQVVALGDEEEGQIFLPTAMLKARY